MEENQLRQLAENGKAEAQYQLGMTISNLEEAFQWFLRSAEQGYLDAYYALGDC